MTAKYVDREIESLTDVLGAHALKILKTNGVKNIKDLLALLDEHGEIPKLEGCGAASYSKIERAAKRAKLREHEISILDCRVSEINLSHIAWSHLARNGIETVRDLLTTDEEFIKGMQNIGKISLKQIISKKEEIIKSLSDEELEVINNAVTNIGTTI